MEDTEWWSYHPRVFADIDVDSVVEEVAELLSNQRSYNGEVQTVSRLSCVFTDDIKQFRRQLPNYHDMLVYSWDRSPSTENIKERLEERMGHSFDYVLFHIYSDGTASIGYHNDKESLNGEVVSVSLGQRRKFRIRTPGQTVGYLREYLLGEGDLFVMKKGMQRKYIHGVPKELRVKEKRLNWTFRSFEKKD